MCVLRYPDHCHIGWRALGSRGGECRKGKQHGSGAAVLLLGPSRCWAPRAPSLPMARPLERQTSARSTSP
eukprot:7848563-Alexandrium_andersonii.AAC.1